MNTIKTQEPFYTHDAIIHPLFNHGIEGDLSSLDLDALALACYLGSWYHSRGGAHPSYQPGDERVLNSLGADWDTARLQAAGARCKSLGLWEETPCAYAERGYHLVADVSTEDRPKAWSKPTWDLTRTNTMKHASRFQPDLSSGARLLLILSMIILSPSPKERKYFQLESRLSELLPGVDVIAGYAEIEALGLLTVERVQNGFDLTLTEDYVRTLKTYEVALQVKASKVTLGQNGETVYERKWNAARGLSTLQQVKKPKGPESWQVYLLRDPNTLEIRYVGIAHNAITRAQSHAWFAGEGFGGGENGGQDHSSNPLKYAWYKGLSNLGQLPETIILSPGITCTRKQAEEQENAIIVALRAMGSPLFNIVGVEAEDLAAMKQEQNIARYALSTSQPVNLDRVAKQPVNRDWDRAAMKASNASKYALRPISAVKSVSAVPAFLAAAPF